MIKLSGLFIIILSLVIFYGCGSSEDSSLILIDTSRNYPESNLRLSDVAEVKYIPLQYGKDSVIFAGPGFYAVTVYRDTIFILNWKPFSLSQIILYDTLGNPLSKIDKQGRGPNEYVHLISYMLDTTKRELYGWDDKSSKILAYDLSGNCLREQFLSAKYTQMANLNEDFILGYNSFSLMESVTPREIINTGRKTITFLGKDDFAAKVYDFDYEKPYPNKTSIFLRHLTHTKYGIYIINDRSDTVYFIDRNLRLTPRIVDVTPHSGHRMSAIMPIIETDSYIFLSNEYYRDKNIAYKHPNFYVYDKKEKQIYSLKSDTSLDASFLSRVNNYIAVD